MDQRTLSPPIHLRPCILWRTCSQLSPVAVVISNSSSGLPTRHNRLLFSEMPVFLRTSVLRHSIRFSKCDRLELLKSFPGKRFGRSLGWATASDSSRWFPIHHLEVRFLPPQPPIPAWPENGPEIPAFAHSLSSLDYPFADLEVEIVESLRPRPRIFPFCGDYRWRIV